LLKEGSKSDRIDARKLAELLRSNTGIYCIDICRAPRQGLEWQIRKRT
jgi:hypothetical protein